MTVAWEARACRASSASREMRASPVAALVLVVATPARPVSGSVSAWPSKAGSRRPSRAETRVGVRSVSWTRPAWCVESPTTRPPEAPRALLVPAGRTAIWGPGASSSAREATMMRVPGRDCSWTMRRASSRAAIRSVSVEAALAVSTMVRSASATRASATDGATGAGLFAEPPGAPVASCVLGPTVWTETSCPSAPTRGVLRGIAAVGPAQEADASTALARLPRPRVSQASAGQVWSAGVRTDRFIGSPRWAKASRRSAAEPTPEESELSPAPSREACSCRSAQVRLFVARTTTGAGREDECEAEAASDADVGWDAGAASDSGAVGAAVARAGPTTARIMPMTTSSTRTYTTPRTRRC